MKTKKYPAHHAHREKTASRVQEAGVGYGREVSRKDAISPGISLAQAKKRLDKPVKRDAKGIRWAMGIAGIGSGPKDLSEHMRDYLLGDK